MLRDHAIETHANGRSYVVVPYEDDLGGHLETVKHCANVSDWGIIDKPLQKVLLVPTYAYDRVVVAGLSCGT